MAALVSRQKSHDLDSMHFSSGFKKKLKHFHGTLEVLAAPEG